MIPQETQDVTVSFTLSIRTNYAGDKYFIENIPVELQLSDFTGDTGEWLMNHCITYTITVNPVTGKILFDPTLTEDWIDSPNNTMYVE